MVVDLIKIVIDFLLNLIELNSLNQIMNNYLNNSNHFLVMINNLIQNLIEKYSPVKKLND